MTKYLLSFWSLMCDFLKRSFVLAQILNFLWEKDLSFSSKSFVDYFSLQDQTWTNRRAEGWTASQMHSSLTRERPMHEDHKESSIFFELHITQAGIASSTHTYYLLSHYRPAGDWLWNSFQTCIGILYLNEANISCNSPTCMEWVWKPETYPNNMKGKYNWIMMLLQHKLKYVAVE